MISRILTQVVKLSNLAVRRAYFSFQYYSQLPSRHSLTRIIRILRIISSILIFCVTRCLENNVGVGTLQFANTKVTRDDGMLPPLQIQIPSSFHEPARTSQLHSSTIQSTHSLETKVAQLTSDALVRQYLQGQDFSESKYDFNHPSTIQPLKGGSTNFTFRLTFENSQIGNERLPPSSAIFKFAAEYAVVDPNSDFSSERQLYEAHASQYLAPALKLLQHETSSLVKLPIIYFFDPEVHVLIEEDVAATTDDADDSEGPPAFYSLREICRQSSSVIDSRELMEIIVSQLGHFLALLHKLPTSTIDRSLEANAVSYRELFINNSASRKANAQTTFTKIPEKLQKYGNRLTDKDTDLLEKIVEEMSSEMLLQQQDFVTMGDFWYGNIIVKLSSTKPPRSVQEINMIDWEFATCAPTYTDLGHFLSEVWLFDRFFQDESAANKQVAAAVFKAYASAGQSIDAKKVCCYVGGHICCFLDYGNWTQDSVIKQKVAREGLDMLFNAHSGRLSELKKDSLLASVLGLG